MAVQSSREKPRRKTIGPKKKIAFVCSGGATKAGAFHLGVALALQEQGFDFFGGVKPTEGPLPTPKPMEISTYVGSSAGSIITTYLACGYSLDNILNSFLGKPFQITDPEDRSPGVLPRLTYQKMFRLRGKLGPKQLSQAKHFRHLFSNLLEGNWEALVQFKWLKIAGLFSTEGLEEYLRNDVLPVNRFDQLLADLFITATELNRSQKVVFGDSSHNRPPSDPGCIYSNLVGISQACAASTSLPVIYAPYQIQDTSGRKTDYIDGEIRDTLSSHVAVDNGADLVIASYTHQPFHAPKTLSLVEHGISAIVIQSIYLLIEQKINKHIHNKAIQRNAIDAVLKYCKEQNLKPNQIDRIVEILEEELNHKRDVDTIYIHPNPRDSHLFFGDHFTLSPRKMTEIAKSGFRSAIEILRKYEFTDYQERPPMREVDSK